MIGMLAHSDLTSASQKKILISGLNASEGTVNRDIPLKPFSIMELQSPETR